MVSALTALKAGEKGVVLHFKELAEQNLRKLTSLGILPGIEIEVLQTYPVYVVQAEYTQLALDHDIAGMIIVNKKEGKKQRPSFNIFSLFLYGVQPFY
ncbi:hypothetical protein P22_0087 [Propionispora sp. 2/2-37]|uniref:FeoA family protein n=1 Tax=Propionispora sp. 2/2-37 TaxID=1677858 RepID=UPI0006BB857B|nr:FeoA family protein [Propionispora sp. 2/2-37]CUH94025.1 hypothetical protein P22_0087 [Propionispora sp. 2/2-37]